MRSNNNPGNNTVLVTVIDLTDLNKTKLVSRSLTIIDEILLFFGNLGAILIYMECVYKLFLK